MVKLTLAQDYDSKLTLVASGLRQADTQDPLGLLWTTFRRDPRAVEPPARQFDTRKDIRHQQGGATWERRFGPDRLVVSAHVGQRSVTQYLAIPVAAQANARHAGGVVDFDRRFHGLGARWTAERSVGSSSLTVTAGFDYERSQDDRRGFENFIGTTLGVKGAIRRDETNTVTSADSYLQAIWEQGAWQWSAGLRQSRVRFKVSDRFVSEANPDDSGVRSYRRSTPAFGVAYEFDPSVNLYASVGTGFETPTFNELSYATPDTGFNFDLKPARSRQVEIGLKAMVGEATRVNLALFEIRTRDEIVVAESLGGRTSFRNAASTLRRGVEFSFESELGPTLGTRGALTLLRARYDADFDIVVNGIQTKVARGNHMPGIPATTAFLELAWQPTPGLTLAGEVLYRGKMYVEDLNRARPAPAHTLLNLRLAAEQSRGAWTFSQFLRLDNVFDRPHVGSVIVGQAQQRYYEPGPTRSWYGGLRVDYRF